MSYPHTLPGLTDREAVADALYRAVIGIDTNDRALWDSAWVKTGDGCCVMNGTEIKGADLDKIFENVGPMDTTHHVSNVRVNLAENADNATATAYGLHQHYRQGEGAQPGAKNLLVGGRYNCELIKDHESGLWRMKKWIFDIVWRNGDSAVMQR